MFLKLLCCLSGTFLVAVAAGAQQPLASMPYSPSLDVTSMDRAADPCLDFYAYSCGGWMKNNPIPADQASWSVYAKLGNENRRFLWGILEEDAKATNRTPVQQKVGDYFAACMNTAAVDALGSRPVEAEMARINAARTVAEITAEVARLNHLMPGAYFFGAGTSQDAIDSSVMIAAVGAGGLGLPDRDYYDKTDADTVKVREKYLVYVQQLLHTYGEPAGEAKADTEAILRIETALAKASLTRVEQRDPHNLYHMKTVAELSALTPAVDWRHYLEMVDAGSVARLNVAEPAFMQALQKELSGEPVEALRAYLRFHLLNQTATYLAQPLAEVHFDFYGRTLRGIPSMPPRWKTCTSEVDSELGEALGQEFVRRTFSADTKAKTLLMTGQIEAAMQHEIETLEWMSPATKREALAKLHAIRNKIGYPDQWRDYSAVVVKRDDYFGDVLRASQFEEARQWHKLGKPVDLNEWGMTPPTVNAYFNPQMNDINFPAGVLQPPLYDVKLDDAPNYGNTGATIGHELTHAFDDEGRQFDAKGNLRDWWTAEDAKGFEERIDCVRGEYAGYVVVDDIHINSKLTSGEDVADLGGTLLAYMAWKQQTAGQVLGNAEGLTPDQRFFVGMAQWACENTRPENLRVTAKTDPHSPGSARINGVVANLPEFARAFGCKAGQPMVHAPMCKVW
ncbi:MAG TPA: M13 family metallopeptidase [Acidobacteriaceae bacterium]